MPRFRSKIYASRSPLERNDWQKPFSSVCSCVSCISWTLRLLPVFNDLYDLPHKRTVAFRRAGAQFPHVQAVARTIFGAGEPLTENRSIIEICKFTGFNGKCPPARVVEEKKPLGQFVEMNLVADDENVGVVQKIVPCPPDGLADRADFKWVGFRL